MPITTADNCRPRCWPTWRPDVFCVPTAILPAYVARFRYKRLRMMIDLSGKPVELCEYGSIRRILVAYPTHSAWLGEGWPGVFGRGTGVRFDDACPGQTVDWKDTARGYAAAPRRGESYAVIPGTVVLRHSERMVSLSQKGPVGLLCVPPSSLAPFVAAMRPTLLPREDEFDVWHERMARLMAVTNDCPRDILADMAGDYGLPEVERRIRRLFCKPA